MRRGGRKRSKTFTSVDLQTGSRNCEYGNIHRDQISPVQDSEIEDFIPTGVGVFESGSFASRCSLRLINEVVSKFDLYKKGIVKALGFEGILHFPEIKQINRRFSMWLMSCVDARSATLNIGQHISIRFTKSDVGHVLGISSAGKRVVDPCKCSPNAKQRVLDNFVPKEFKDHRSVKVVQEIIECQYMYPMSKTDEDNFRVAFVIFVVSNLLAPSAKHDYASIDYWNAIEQPDIIHTYDWSEYVVLKLLEAVEKLKADLGSGIKFPIISGCSIFLQVFYLDSLEIEGHMTCHNSFPRIRDFSFEKMRCMILADRNFGRHSSGDGDLPCVKLRDPLGCVYSWSSRHSSMSEESTGGGLLAIWECAVAIVNILNIPLEAAGPVFVAAADFHQQINSGLLVCGTQVIKFMTTLVNIMLPYTRGYRYQHAPAMESGSEEILKIFSNGLSIMSEPSRLKEQKQCKSGGCQCARPSSDAIDNALDSSVAGSETSVHTSASLRLDCLKIGDHAERSFNNAVSSIDDIPHCLNVDLRVATAMTQYYALVRSLKPPLGFDLNSSSVAENNHREESSDTSCSHSVIPPPWDLGYSWTGDGLDISYVSSMFEFLRMHDCMAIVHRAPKYIQVSGGDMCAQLMGQCEMELDMFDALIRAVRQEDDQCYAEFGVRRWRHIFESDFMGGILSGSFDLTLCGVREQIPAGDINYDLSKCKILFFPTILQCAWVCFAWSLEDNVLNVFEPSFTGAVPQSRVLCIERCCYNLKIAMRSLAGDIFNALPPHRKYPDIRLLTIPDAYIPRVNRSGALCYMFCCCFDGVELYTKDGLGDTGWMASKMLFQIRNLKDNEGALPPSDMVL